MTALLRRLAAAWKPFSVERRCRKGASAAARARLGRLGAVPAELAALLAWHDGSGAREVAGYYRLLSCAEIVRAKQRMDALVPEFEEAWKPGEWWSRDWIPFLEFNGDLICVDGDGRVVGCKAYDDARPILHRTFRHWLATVAAQWESMPPGADEDEQTGFFDGRAAARIFRRLNPGHPIARRARKKPAEKAPRGLEYACEMLARPPMEWHIERGGALVRVYVGRTLSGRYIEKPFPSLEKARAFMEAQVKQKLREGYRRQRAPLTRSSDKEFLAAAGRHMAKLRR